MIKTSELLVRITSATGQSPADAADRLDQLVTQVLARLRPGKKITVRGLGTVRQDPSREGQ